MQISLKNFDIYARGTVVIRAMDLEGHMAIWVGEPGDAIFCSTVLKIERLEVNR